mmetsp:Transcript_3070/g.9130  ORF Transcript_3070/g.9130 Transcript_3070/m.9130 type:complete len:576 (-) Transcript_3070:11-1738(-)
MLLGRVVRPHGRRRRRADADRERLRGRPRPRRGRRVASGVEESADARRAARAAFKRARVLVGRGGEARRRRGRDADRPRETPPAAGSDVKELAAARAGGLCRRTPADASARRAVADVAPFLVEAQITAATKALTSRVSLVQGPPGTGKTKTAAAALAAAVRLRDREAGNKGTGRGRRRALACAVSNVAADNLLEATLALNVSAVRVGHPAATRESLRNWTLDAAAARLAQPGEDLAKADTRRALRRRALLEADVVVASCVGAGCDDLAPFLTDGRANAQTAAELEFGMVLVDEAAQATEPAALVPLACAPGCTQFVLVGDPAQLPPTVLSRDAERGGLGESLFERLVAAGLAPSLLTTQYRMHPALNVFSSGRFYDGRVRTCPNVAASRVGAKPPKGVAWPNASAPLAFVAIEGTDNERRDADRGKAGDGDGASVSNAAERDALVGVVRGLLARSDVAPSDVGVITPYAAQARAVRDALGASPDLGAGAVEVNTVDAYQGREKNIILVSTVRSNAEGRLGFVADERRLNVALTRARKAVVVVGDRATLETDGTWRAFLERCARDGCVVEGALGCT